MKLKVRFFASLRERLGVAEADIECPDATTVSLLRDILSEHYRQPQALFASPLVSVN